MSKNKTEKRCISRTFSAVPDINIISNREALVTGTKSITEYTADMIRLNCGHLLLTVKGNCLNMTALSVDEVIIKGELTSFEFSRNHR